MTKFAKLMILIGLVGYTIGCGGTTDDTTPAPPAGTGGEAAPADGEGA